MSFNANLPATALPPALTRRERSELEAYLGHAAHERQTRGAVSLISFTVTLVVMLAALSMLGLHPAGSVFAPFQTALATIAQR